MRNGMLRLAGSAAEGWPGAAACVDELPSAGAIVAVASDLGCAVSIALVAGSNSGAGLVSFIGSVDSASGDSGLSVTVADAGASLVFTWVDVAPLVGSWLKDRLVGSQNRLANTIALIQTILLFVIPL